MALIVEDGSEVANANSYIDITFLDAYASERGYVIPSTAADKEKFALIAMDYIESHRDYFIGAKVTKTQELQWPRKSAYIDGFLFAKDDIPEAIKKAQAQLVVEQQASNKLFPDPVTDVKQGIVVEEQIGPLKTRYSGLGSGRNILASRYTPIPFASVSIFLKPLLKSGAMQVLRV